MGGDSMESTAVANHIGNTIDTADIYNKLTQNGSCPVSGFRDRFYTRGGLELVLIWRLPMSEKLAYQLEHGIFCGNLACLIVIDSDIFLWNDDTNDDLAYFDAVESTVLKNTLARVKSDVFAHNTGWFGMVVSVVWSISQSLLSTLIQFLGPGSEELEQVAVDKSRNILYCLGKNGSVQVFDLDADGNQCSTVCVVSAGQIASEAHLMTQYGHEESTFTNIATKCALEAEQSNQLNLVAITTKGVRIYFSVLARTVAAPNQQGQYSICRR